MASNKAPIIMQLLFNRIESAKPQQDNIYWCIVECESPSEGGVNKEYHYSFIEWKNKSFNVPQTFDDMRLRVVAWCELENPAANFKDPARIIQI